MPNPSQDKGSAPAQAAAKPKNTKQRVLIVALVLLLFAAAIIIFLLLWPKDEGLGLVTDDNLGTIGNQLAQKVDEGMFQTYMNTTWYFPKGDGPTSTGVMGNSDSNLNPFYFTVVLHDEETGTDEEIYRSGVIPVGKVSKEFTLDKPLPPGEYNATCYVHLLNAANEEIESDLGFAVTLKVAG